jgi:hypothetical protein
MLLSQVTCFHIVRIQLDGMKEPTTPRSEENDDRDDNDTLKGIVED